MAGPEWVSSPALLLFGTMQNPLAYLPAPSKFAKLGQGEGGGELSLASPAVSHLGSHPAECLKQPGKEACLWVLHCLLCSRGLLLPVAFVVGEEGEELRWRRGREAPRSSVGEHMCLRMCK